jgi:predicted Zn-dependent peptidase
LNKRVIVEHKDTAQVQVALDFLRLVLGDERNPVAQMLAVILGGNMSSRLFTQVRERRGLAYSVSAGNYLYDDVGAFSIRAGLDRTRTPLAIKTIIGELKKIAKSGVTTQELKDAKTFLHGQVSIRMEDSQDRAEWYAKQAMFQSRIKSPATYLKQIDAVTQANVQSVAREILNQEKMCLAVIGPYKNAEEFLSNVKL